METRARSRILFDPDAHGAVRARLQAEIVGFGEIAHRGDEIGLLLEDGDLLGQLALLIERRSVVVRRVDDGGIRLPAPARAAVDHVQVLRRELVFDVVGVKNPLERGPRQRATALVTRATPGIEGAALKLTPEERSLRDAGAQEAIVGEGW